MTLRFLCSRLIRPAALAVAFTYALCTLNPIARADDVTNVTSVVAAAVKDNKLSISASNDTFGDTVPGVPKKLHVEYRLDDKKLHRDVNENGRMEIAAPAGQKLVIVKAVYGPADGAAAPPSEAAGDPAAALETLPGFKVETVLKADRVKNGSWICMTVDPKGRLLLGAQRGQPITRVTLDGGKLAKQEALHIPVTETMGMLFVDNVLYLDGAGADGKFGLYRCRDTKGDDSYDDVQLLREWHGGAGEHGAHAIVLGPDKMLYVVAGNFTDPPSDLAPTSPHRNYADDIVLKRAEDGNGFGAGKQPPGGFVVRMDLDGKNPELFSAGLRNTYGIAFNADGELFGFDSDMEWDWGTPWYRPIRAFHSVRGGDQGFREGSAKWPDYYFDSLPATSIVGIGSPTCVVFGAGAKFPLKYQKACYMCDWTYGRLIALHLKPDGASYSGEWENLVAPKSLHGAGGKTPLNLTGVVIGGDGALYFTIGGRGTQACLFRVTYTGQENATPVAAGDLQDKEGAEARALRHKLEAFNVKPDPAAVDFAWPHLNSPDRFIRYAARMAIERNPVAEWQAKALAEKQPEAALTALLALARLGGDDVQPALWKAISSIPFASLTEPQRLEKLRVIEVAIARHGAPTGEAAKQLIAELDPLYPAKSVNENRELCQLLVRLNAPGVVARSVALLKAAPTQEEQLTYVMALRNVKTGWNVDQRKTYLAWWNGVGRSTEHPAYVVKWFEDAGIHYNNGASFSNFLSHAHEEAKFSMSPDEIVALNDVLTAYGGNQSFKPISGPPRKVVKTWTTADLQPLLEQVGKGRNFARGKQVFSEAKCLACHRYGDQGGAIGPDLTAVATRFKRQDILESITEPSKVLSEQYANTQIETTDGRVFVGRIVNETADKVQLRPDPLQDATVSVTKADIESRKLSKISPMPEGLINTFNKDEILDLLAFLESLGDPNHPDFKP